MKLKKAFTMAEAIIAIIIAGVISSCLIIIIKPGDVRGEALKKSGLNMLFQVNYATKQILAKYSTNYQMTSLRALDETTFSINDVGADEKLIELYKKLLIPSRNQAIDASYTNLDLYNEQETKVQDSSDLKISSFTKGFKTKNGSYFAIKLESNCTASKNCIYNPLLSENRNVSKSCGLIFFDVNGEDDPNVVGVDQYIISINKNGD